MYPASTSISTYLFSKLNRNNSSWGACCQRKLGLKHAQNFYALNQSFGNGHFCVAPFEQLTGLANGGGGGGAGKCRYRGSSAMICQTCLPDESIRCIPVQRKCWNCKYLMSLMISLCNCGSGQRIFHVLLPPRLPNLNLHNKIQIQQVQQDQKVAKNSENCDDLRPGRWFCRLGRLGVVSFGWSVGHWLLQISWRSIARSLDLSIK